MLLGENMTERIIVIYKKEEILSTDYQCDLCDKTVYPMLSWGCYHDDDAHKTVICIPCITKINQQIPDGLRSDIAFRKIEGE